MITNNAEHFHQTLDVTFAGGQNKYLHKGFSTDSFTCAFYDFEFVTRGRFLLHMNNQIIEIKKGDLYIVPPHILRKKVVLEEGTATKYMAVQLPEIKSYIAYLPIDNNIIICHLTEQSIQYMTDLIDSAEQYCEFEAYSPDDHRRSYTQGVNWANQTPHEAELRQSGLLFLFLSQLLHDHGGPDLCNASQMSKDEYVRKAMKFIKANYKDDISVDSVAKAIGLHRSYLYTLFQQYAGISVCDYIIQARIDAACDFLKQGSIPIKSVALSVGYSPITFARTFKKQMGITATEYQKLHAKPEDTTATSPDP